MYMLRGSVVDALAHFGLTPADLETLNKLPLITSIVGVVVIGSMWVAVATPAWLSGTALYDGLLYEAHLSLTHVQFGEGLLRVCGETKCPLNYMCEHYDATLPQSGAEPCPDWLCGVSASPPPSAPTDFVRGVPHFTPRETWCYARDVGAWTLSLLWLGFFPGLIATGLTMMYAAKQIANFPRTTLVLVLCSRPT